jgi:hypothetical protein
MCEMKKDRKQVLAEYARGVFEKPKQNEGGTITIPKRGVDRWKRQALTRYKDLPKEEQILKKRKR